MQRVSNFLPAWEKRNSGSKASIHSSKGSSSSPAASRSWWANRSSSSSVNGLAKINVAAANNARVQREAFWPATLDLECDKAARILKSFCADGYLAPSEDEPPSNPSSSDGTQISAQTTKKIPKRIIQNAAGIAVFTCMRSGLWMTGSGGSGILIARKSDGTWSPPSGIMLHTPTLSFIMGVDIYDCVLVVNNLAALESITRPRVTLGEDVRLTAGSLVTLDSTEADIRWKDLGNTVLTYMKARGQHQNVNLKGCILTERGNENERFYAPHVTQMDILAGNVTRHVEETRPLAEVIKMAEGRTDFDAAVIKKIATEPAPGDAVIATPGSTPASPRNAFGVPSAHDPDPFGVLALEMAGLEIREAGTHLRPSSKQFDFTPSPTSPSAAKFNRQSVETFTTKSNRGSYMSTRTTKSQVTDTGTQTDVNNTPGTSPSPGQSEDGIERQSIDQITAVKEEEVDYTTIDMTALHHLSQSTSVDVLPTAQLTAGSRRQSSRLSYTVTTPVVEEPKQEPNIPKISTPVEDDGNEDSDNTNDADDEEDESEEEPVVFEVAAAVQPMRNHAVASRMIQAKGSMVTIPKRLPPPLPARSPARVSRSSKSEMGGDVSGLGSPLRQSLTEPVLVPGDEVEDGVVAQPQDLEAGDSEVEEAAPEDVALPDIKSDEVESLEEHVESGDSIVANPPNEETRIHDDQVEANADIEASQDETMAVGLPAADKRLMSDGQDEETEKSDSETKRLASSILTGTTSDHWNHDRSSVTTPTSDRPHSVEGEPPLKDTKINGFDNSNDDQVDDMVTPTPEAISKVDTAAAFS